MITYIKDDLFHHIPKQKDCISILAHACNCRGSWGGGIAAIFKIRYPDAFTDYACHCHKYNKEPPQLLGSTLLIKPNTSTVPYVACLFTSDMSGPFILDPPAIVNYTELALHHLSSQITALQHTGTVFETDHDGNVVINMPKINAGIFNVPWDDTALVLDKFSHLHFNVYVVD